MNISKQSSIYKFMNESLVLENEFVPTNLCPFMRRFLFGIGMTFFLYWLGILVVGILVSPLLLFFNGLSINLIIVAVFGLIIDVFILAKICLMAFKNSLPARKITAAKKAIAETSTVSLFVAWAKAAHDKVCPNIRFE